MRLDTTTQPARATTVEPSRAWILGLVVDADGSFSAAAPEPEWPAPVAPGPADPGTDQITFQDGLPVRP